MNRIPMVLALVGVMSAAAWAQRSPGNGIMVAPIELSLLSSDDVGVDLEWTCFYVVISPPGLNSTRRELATAYDLRYSTADVAFEEMTPVTGVLPAPDAGGVSQTFRVLGLDPSTTYRFVMRTIYRQDPIEVISDSEPFEASTTAAVTPPDAISNPEPESEQPGSDGASPCSSSASLPGGTGPGIVFLATTLVVALHRR